MPVTEIDMNAYHVLDAAPNVTTTHLVTKGRLDYFDGYWYCKKIEESRNIKYELQDGSIHYKKHSAALRARTEQASLEFFRLIIPTQPQTLIGKDNTDGSYYILTKEVPGLSPLPNYEMHRFNRGNYTGLGAVLLVSIFLYEMDLNEGNIGINMLNQVIKIDGDWCLSKWLEPELLIDTNTHITQDLISSLPFLKDYSVFNWLDIIKKGQNLHASTIVNPQLSDSPIFRAELNQAMLSIILLPRVFILAFVDLYISEKATDLQDLLFARQQELKATALKNSDFLGYIKEIDLDRFIEDYLSYLQQFLVHGTRPILDISTQEQCKLELYALKQGLILQLSNKLSSPTTVSHITMMDSKWGGSIAADDSQTTLSAGPGLFGSKPVLENKLRLNRTMSDLSAYL